MTRLLVAGSGMIGRRHIAHARETEGIELVGVVDPSPVAPVPDGVPLWPDFDAVDAPVDGVVIATPTATHAPLALAAIARGWPALVEKPVAGTLEDADRIVEASEAAGVPVLVGHHRRHHPRLAAFREIVRGGAVGEPIAAVLIWCMKKEDAYFDPAWRQGPDGGPVRQNLIHEVDALRWILGEVTSVAGAPASPRRFAPERPESGAAVLTFDSGAVATIAFSDDAPSPWGFEAATGESPSIPSTGQDCLRVIGRSGAAEFPSLSVWSGAASWHEAPTRSVVEAPDGVPLVRQLQHFADVIAGRAAPITSAADGRATLDATLGIEAATLPETGL